MAVDTALKRFSMMSLVGEAAGLPPMWSFTTTPGGPAFRAQQLWLYTGIALEEPPAAGDAPLPYRFIGVPVRLGI